MPKSPFTRYLGTDTIIPSVDPTISSVRLFQRLNALPSDPHDPESVDEVIVVAFGAFERYFVCWRNKGGEYRQDAFGLPPRLQEWLFFPRPKETRSPTTPLPPSGGFKCKRNAESLQVILGHGEEFFASDAEDKISHMNDVVENESDK
ncbi:hypothetical protein K402DRAFT_322022, partial [Aulographum hederae CBS 113979]